jgi:hypothetical protein
MEMFPAQSPLFCFFASFLLVEGSIRLISLRDAFLVACKEGKGKMKPLDNRRFVIAVLTVACLLTVLVAGIRSSFSGAGDYDPWLDTNDDGKIDMKDIGAVARAFGTSGQNISKAGLAYDSGWLDIRNETGETYTVTHNLNDTSLQVDVREFAEGGNRTYGGTNDDEVRALVQSSDGGYALAGTTFSFGAGSGDFWLVKTDASGKAQWNKTYGGTGDDEAFALVQTADGGYALAGGTSSSGGGDYDFWLVKTDASGTMQWNQTYGGQFFEEAEALVQTSDGGYALAGDAQSFSGHDDFWLVKTDASGNMMWNQTYGDANKNSESVWALVQTGDGGYALAGRTGSLGSGFYDCWLVKTDASGSAQWNQTYGGTGTDEPWALVRTIDGGYAIAGFTSSFGAGVIDAWLVKTDASGNTQWNHTYGGTNDDYAFAMVQTSDGGYALAGETWSFSTNAHSWLVKTDASGTMQWNQTYGGTNDDWAMALIQASDDGYALAGRTHSFGAGQEDFWLVKTDSSGNVGGVESGLAWGDLSANTITLYRAATDTSWNYVRVRLWKPR